MVDINEAVVRDSTMWWVERSGLEFFSTLGLPTIQVLDRQDMLSSDLGLGNVFRWIRLFLGLFYWVHQSLQKSCKKGRFSFYSILTKWSKHLLAHHIWDEGEYKTGCNTDRVQDTSKISQGGIPGPKSFADGRSVKGPQGTEQRRLRLRWCSSVETFCTR